MNNDAKAQINAGVKPHSLTELETKVCTVLREIINDTARVKSYFRNVDTLNIVG
jgi:hypothetical protein